MFENIPSELRSYPQWVVWRYEQETPETKPTKVPFTARWGTHASSIDRNTWATFEEAQEAYNRGGWSGIGFVLDVNDPFCFIDLDDPQGDLEVFERQKRILSAFDTYSEFSPSGRGVHLICKASVRSGRKRKHVEMYSNMRFMTMTGNTMNGAIIEDRQLLADILWGEIGSSYDDNYVAGDIEMKYEDDVVLQRAYSARNGDKFRKLWDGEWSTTQDERTSAPYPSQSEADFALINIIAFHTKNRMQIRRLFLASALGKRPKAYRMEYVERMITRAFDMTIPEVDFDGLRNAIELAIAQKETGHTERRSEEVWPVQLAAVQTALASVEETSGLVNSSNLPAEPLTVPPKYESNKAATAIPLPPGIVGELAQFIFEAAPRPVSDIALMGSIGLMAGICGRSWNISGTGLNLYMLLLAKTGRGKEAMSSGVDKIINSVAAHIPAIHNFIGPGDIASGQAVVKYLANTSPVWVSIISEFDKLIAGLSHQRANPAMIMLKKIILDAYSKSGAGQTYRPMIYSDAAKSTKTVQSPCMSILGECTPEKFYDLLDESLIAEGLLPRFMVIEYLGDRVDYNPHHVNAQPSQRLSMAMRGIVETSLILQRGTNNNFRALDIAVDPKSDAMLTDFDKFCTDCINNSNRDAISQLWNRAHLKALKVAGLIAVGCNTHRPEVTEGITTWAIRLVERDVRSMLARFDAGEIGSDEGKQLSELRRAISEFITLPYEKCASKYGCPRALYNARIVPMRYLTSRLHNISCFRRDRVGATASLKRNIGILLDQSEVVLCNREQLGKEVGSTGTAYMVKEMRL